MRRIEQYDYFFEKENGELREENKKTVWSNIYDWADSIAVAMVAISVLFAFVFRVVQVSGSSMYPTLNDGDWLAVTNIGFEIKRGEIVVITQPNSLHEPLIKRIIGVGGDTVDIDFVTSTVTVNGEVLNEPYISELTRNSDDVQFPLVVPEGKVFVMGDNRNMSLDSRSSTIGFIDERYLLGEALVRFLPFGEFIIE